mmetsp:Transcript_25084/g.72327  ORF Transcript_25084/g.72327 Transcript_25084/m.72327 type:complete len:179 (-) Transcript_25084:279-815(-)
MSVHVDSIGVDIVALLVMELLVLHVRLSLRRRDMAIRLWHWRSMMMMMMMTMMGLALTVNLFPRTNTIEVEIRKAATDLGHNASPTSRISNSTVAMAIGGTRLRTRQMRPHRFYQTNSLGMGCNRQGTLNHIIAKRIHHQFADAFWVTEFVQVLFLDAICAALETLLHDIGAELLNSQ